MPILNAYLVPENVQRALYPSITPVNSLRVLLREHYGEPLETLPDRSIFSWYRTPNVTLDVTEKVTR
jgi:hypothetical protein